MSRGIAGGGHGQHRGAAPAAAVVDVISGMPSGRGSNLHSVHAVCAGVYYAVVYGVAGAIVLGESGWAAAVGVGHGLPVMLQACDEQELIMHPGSVSKR